MRITGAPWSARLFAALALSLLICASGEKSSAKEDARNDPVTAKNATRVTSRSGRTSDLEESETTYSGSFVSYKTYVTHVPQPSYMWTSTPSGQRSPGAVKNASCGDFFTRQCQPSRYRAYDGSCNNPYRPAWGMANTRYGRLLPASYGDGIQSPTVSTTGQELPLSRAVSYVLFPNVDVDDRKWTLVAMQWGQIITHDMAMIDGSTQSKPHATKCCTDDGKLLDKFFRSSKCYPIVLPENDPVYSRSAMQCLNFVRSTTDLDRGCSSRNKPAEQLTVVTHFLDLSLVYGSSEQTARNLRAGVGGRMRVDIRLNREWPPSAANKSADCDIDYQNDVCYQTGDARSNQNTQLTILQVILLREHNRVASYLARLNPHWNDETIFQETRRILIAEHQHISYYEWMPIFLGSKNLYSNKVLYHTSDFVNDYDPTVDPSVLNEHSNAAFRYFHSLIAGYLNKVDRQRSFPSESLRLSDYFNKPGIIERGNNMADLTRGMAYQPQKASDQYFDEEITQYLFKNGNPLGGDLRATDIQRNRDHGLASYNAYREYCGLPRARDFDDFMDWISAENVAMLSQLYDDVEDVDLTVGGSLERHQRGTLSGPTFLCILTEQFYRTRVGDRFWYEHGDSDLTFTIEQLTELRKASISRLFCDNGDDITLMQPRGFEQVSEQNPIMSCDDLPEVNLALWKDYAPELAGQPARAVKYVPVYEK